MDLAFLKKFVPERELHALVSGLNGEEGKYFKEILEVTEKRIMAVPPLGFDEEIGLDARVHLHYFGGATDIYISELDFRTLEAFGFTCLNGDRWNAELGYSNISEIISIPLMELDLHFDNSVTLGEIVERYKAE